MDYRELKEEIKQKLKDELEVAYPAGEFMMVVRCPFCGDSKKNPTKGHFYIKLNTRNEEDPIVYMCQRCTESGLFTPSIMRSLGVNDLTLNSALIVNNNKVIKSSRKALGVTDNSFNLKVPMPNEQDERNIHKLNYINKRMGLDLSFKEMVNLKTVFSLGDFLRHNEITTVPHMSRSRLKLIHDNYVGFLTVRNEFINFRNTHEDSNKRYEKYSIFNTIENSRKFYTIPNDIDRLSTRTITINLSEGIFDIWGVYHHIFDRERENMIYAAVCGSAYTSVLKYFIQMGVIGDVDVNIFSDSDRDKNFYKQMVKELKPWVNKFTVYHNTVYDKNGKSDYGVSRDKINLIKSKL